MQQETDGEVSNLSDISAGVGLRHLVKASSTAIREQSTHTHRKVCFIKPTSK